MKTLRIFLLLILVVSIISGYLLHTEKIIDERIYLKEIAPDIRFSEKKGSPPHYSSDEGIVAFNTYDIVPSIKGYAGPIKLLSLVYHSCKHNTVYHHCRKILLRMALSVWSAVRVCRKTPF